MNKLTLDQLAEQSPVATQELIRLRAELAEAKAQITAAQEQEPVYFWREIGVGDWMECNKSWYWKCVDSADLETKTLYTAPIPADKPAINLDGYDAGHLNDYGGGNVGWWHDYIRSELERAYDFYQDQVSG